MIFYFLNLVCHSYASGNTALHIVKVENGQFIYIAQDEVEKGAKRGALLALFEPQGRGTCYHKNGNIRYNRHMF